MLAFLKKIGILLLIVYPSIIVAEGLQLDGRGWLAYGDMRGHIEPCGCDPTADLGGLRRLGTLLQRERVVHKQFFLFNLGNNFSFEPDVDAKASPFILEGTRRLKPDAILFNVAEFRNMKILAGQRHMPFVLTNQKARLPGVSKVIKVGKVYVFGYTYHPSTSKNVKRVGERLLTTWKNLIARKNASEEAVLLFSGPASDLRRIEGSRLFDLVVSANSAKLGKIVGSEERAKPELLQRTKKTRMVPLGAQGVLRGGRLLRNRAKSIAEMLALKKQCKPKTLIGKSPEGCEKPASIFANTTPVSWLPKSYDTGHPFKELFTRYARANADEFQRLVAKRLPLLKSSPFAGSDACKSCHPQAYQVWQSSKHAHAYATLKKVGKHQDSACVKCHVLGLTAKGGFVSEQHSPQFANVTCENCHGARQAHVQKPVRSRMTAGSAAKTCVTCHHGTHTPHFVYADRWSKIKHGK